MKAGCVLAGVVLATCAQAQSAVAGAETREVVRVGVWAMTPYVTIGADGQPHGVLVDFFDREIAPRMGVRFQWERPMTVARLERSLITGRIMFTPMLARTRERLKARVQFADEPYIRLDPCIAVLPDSAITHVATPADLAGVTVGWVQAGALPAFMQDRRIRLDRVGSIDWTFANLEKLRLGRIGAAYFSNPYTPQFFSAKTGMELRIISLPTPRIPLYGAFSPQTPRTLAERYARAAGDAFAGDRFSTYMHRAVVESVLAAPARTDER